MKTKPKWILASILFLGCILAIAAQRNDILQGAAAAVKPQSAQSAGVTSTHWTSLGPGNIGGRIRAILIDRTNANRIWVGSVSGGIWKSTDRGASWNPVNDFMGNLSISSLVMDPANAHILYAGTGEGFFNADAVRGAGIFKSIDGGTTWSQLASTNPANDSSWFYVNRIAVHPTDGNILLAATGDGIFKTTDAGATWSQMAAGRALGISFDPNDGQKAVAGFDNGTICYTKPPSLVQLTMILRLL